uniref:Restriction endonuclease type IV Mrr domain-containing protein n=1 Tax=Thermogemmatispora argillosa TaxID=2045280 RepID=A0A455T6J1_9CHLR|nr:hypothetical protein KTA_26840 [Thermogemmatispora argillosa]
MPARAARVSALLSAAERSWRSTLPLWTSHTYSNEAQSYARSVDNLSIVLIDGEQMAQLMIDHGVGVTEETRYVLKKIDSDYFGD